MIKRILFLAVPAALKYLLDMLQVLIDLFMVSALGIDEVAAVGLGLQFMMVIGVLMTVFSVGGTALISRLKGSGRIYKANKVFYNLLIVALVLAFATTLLIAPFVPYLYTAMQVNSHVALLGDAYFGTLSLGFVLIFLDTLFFTYFSAMGNTTISFYIKIVSASINVLLNYMLIFGHWGAPALGLQGAALATLVATGINILIYLYWLNKNPLYGMIRSFSWTLTREIARLGVPSALERGMSSLSFMFFVAIIASYATHSLAAYQIGLRIEGLGYMLGFGFSVASMTLVGNYLGAKDPQGAQKIALLTSYIAAGIMGVVGMVFLFFPQDLVHLFTHDAPTVAEASIYLQLVGISQVPLAVMFVLSAALRGAGAVKITLYISLASLWALRIIPSWVASIIGADIVWVYIMMTIETFVKGWIFYVVFKKGAWKNIRIRI